jgi:hypothetical protein
VSGALADPSDEAKISEHVPSTEPPEPPDQKYSVNSVLPPQTSKPQATEARRGRFRGINCRFWPTSCLHFPSLLSPARFPPRPPEFGPAADNLQSESLPRPVKSLVRWATVPVLASEEDPLLEPPCYWPLQLARRRTVTCRNLPYCALDDGNLHLFLYFLLTNSPITGRD